MGSLEDKVFCMLILHVSVEEALIKDSERITTGYGRRPAHQAGGIAKEAGPMRSAFEAEGTEKEAGPLGRTLELHPADPL
ncbi:hypothetical protein EYF80_049723 [Liparis tanakae]|uniref:Uncharacterized protein n=1 Tax=Liparis tanakae TaxID=230148 RepID=A0A4Z2FFZ7_9TELE|nr:hypothetical protein EYF80_049723 [Liparis tanakae]